MTVQTKKKLNEASAKKGNVNHKIGTLLESHRHLTQFKSPQQKQYTMVMMNGRELFKSAENINKNSNPEIPSMVTSQNAGRETLLISH